jgi:2,5-diketo-D-gluconate reductase B
MSIELPKIGLGTWELKPDQCKIAVLNAIKVGYRLIDTAASYNNEQAVGAALAESPVPRDELFIATKIFPMNNKPAKLLQGFEGSMKKLGLDVLDLLYIHWPAMGYKAGPTLKTMSDLVNTGRVRNIGLSNFTPKLLDEAKAALDKPIFALQVEHHPLLQQKVLREYCAKNDIHFVAYSPLGRGKLSDIGELTKVAQKYSVSIAQICLAWEIGHGAVPIPKSTSVGHLEDNFKAQDLQLEQEDVELIDSIKVQKRFVNPPIHPKW